MDMRSSWQIYLCYMILMMSFLAIWTLTQARLARRPVRLESAPQVAAEDDDAGEITDATFDERMRAKVSDVIIGE